MEVKLGLRQRQILLPISKPVFELDPAGLTDEPFGEVAPLYVYFEQPLVKGALALSDVRTVVESPRGHHWRFTAGQTTQHDNISGLTALDRTPACKPLLSPRDDLDAAAETRELGLARQEGQRRAPVRALFHLRASYRAVGRHIKPNGLTISNEQLWFGGFVFPAHATRPAEIHGAGLGADVAATLVVALKEHDLQRHGAVAAPFKRPV